MGESFNQKISHLYRRAAFGLAPWELENQKHVSVSETVDKIFDQAKEINPLHLDKELQPPPMLDSSSKATIEKFHIETGHFYNQAGFDEDALNNKWLETMAGENGGLREKMTLFWHGHFACMDFVTLYALKLNNTIRANALGNFRDMVQAVAMESAMLRYLNNQENVKESPNENFAREVMELFTIGRGNYTEQDVKNAARAFTGWRAYNNGAFSLNTPKHDYGVKTFMGHSGNFDGSDIINIILDRKETAHFIAGKAYKYFVNQENPDQQIIAQLGEKFYSSGYEISVLMHEIFSSDWFYDPKNMENRIKSPVELLVGLKRDFKLCFDDPEVQIKIQQILGQLLFQPPNVSGWGGGRNWIDSTTITERLKLPLAIFYASGSGAAPGKMKNSFDISYFNNKYHGKPHKELVDGLCKDLVAIDIKDNNKKLIADVVASDTNNPVLAAIMMVTTLPEYQIC